MYFTFHQICKKDNCTHSFLFCVLLAAFDEHGACSLTELQNKKLLLYLLLLWSENVLKFWSNNKFRNCKLYQIHKRSKDLCHLVEIENKKLKFYVDYR